MSFIKRDPDLFRPAHISWSQTDQSSACLPQSDVTEGQTGFSSIHRDTFFVYSDSLSISKAYIPR